MEKKTTKLYCIVGTCSEGGSALFVECTKKACFDKAHESYREDYQNYKENEGVDSDYVNRRDFQKELLSGNSVQITGVDTSTIYEYFEKELELVAKEKNFGAGKKSFKVRVHKGQKITRFGMDIGCVVDDPAAPKFKKNKDIEAELKNELEYADFGADEEYESIDNELKSEGHMGRCMVSDEGASFYYENFQDIEIPETIVQRIRES